MYLLDVAGESLVEVLHILLLLLSRRLHGRHPGLRHHSVSTSRCAHVAIVTGPVLIQTSTAFRAIPAQKLCYRRRTARRAISVTILSTAAQRHRNKLYGPTRSPQQMASIMSWLLCAVWRDFSEKELQRRWSVGNIFILFSWVLLFLHWYCILLLLSHLWWNKAVNYARPTCSKLRASSHDASTVVGVVNKLDRRRVLLTTRLICRSEIF